MRTGIHTSIYLIKNTVTTGKLWIIIIIIIISN